MKGGEGFEQGDFDTLGKNNQTIYYKTSSGSLPDEESPAVIEVAPANLSYAAIFRANPSEVDEPFILDFDTFKELDGNWEVTTKAVADQLCANRQYTDPGENQDGTRAGVTNDGPGGFTDNPRG